MDETGSNEKVVHRLTSGGNLVVAVASLDYGGPVYETVFIFEFRDGRIATETA
ncbi:hypothetical protein OVA06_16405 [Pseudarthrobacter sp. SL88]|uniref:hypothetical protein n=1 Tax=Pseudarthrobacter sp. SL88 TaxID=2994666 RepID=UPI002273D7EB|nr:hypothetical protein [Pseudarthrobacter sp. SL88]MCY1676263.1 hypothetical protein [Pseudarthrobacter sp. SL88]